MKSPTLRRRRLAAELRRFREAAGLTLEQAAQRTDMSRSTLSRMETGQIGARPAIVRALLLAYGVDAARIEDLVQLARDARSRRGWWYAYGDVVTDLLGYYIGLETEAVRIRVFEPLLVHGLLQTRWYAQAINDAYAVPSPAELVKGVIDARMKRQEILVDENPARLEVVLDEAAVRRQIGGPDVMRDQLKRLIDVAAWPHITIQVLPFSCGAHSALAGDFTILDFADPVADRPVVWADTALGGVLIDNPEQVAETVQVFGGLTAQANSPKESAELIQAVMSEIG